jgi:hypothetical protein
VRVGYLSVDLGGEHPLGRKMKGILQAQQESGAVSAVSSGGKANSSAGGMVDSFFYIIQPRQANEGGEHWEALQQLAVGYREYDPPYPTAWEERVSGCAFIHS